MHRWSGTLAHTCTQGATQLRAAVARQFCCNIRVRNVPFPDGEAPGWLRRAASACCSFCLCNSLTSSGEAPYGSSVAPEGVQERFRHHNELCCTAYVWTCVCMCVCICVCILRCMCIVSRLCTLQVCMCVHVCCCMCYVCVCTS